jgi:hypothetical protein
MPPKTRSTNPAPPRLFSLASQQPVLEPVSERLVKRVGLHRLDDPAAGAYGVELVHEDDGAAVALGELAGLAE